MEIICKTQWYVSVLDCSCINIFLHSCALWKLKRNWVSCAGSPEEYPRHPYIQDDVNTEKDVLGPSRNLFGGFVCRGFIISKQKQTLRNNNWSFTFRFNSIISVSDWNTCQQYNTAGWKLAISHTWAILQHHNMVDFPGLLYSMIGKPILLFSKPIQQHLPPTLINVWKFFFVPFFFCRVPILVVNGVKTIWNFRCLVIWFWEKKTLQAPFANCLYLCFEETLDWNQLFIFSFTVSKAHVTTLSAWGRTRIYAEGAGRKSDLDQGSETRYFSLRSFHEMLWHKTERNSPRFKYMSCWETKSKTPDVEEHVGIWIMFAEFGSFYLQSGFNAPTLWASVAGDSHAYALCSLRPWGIALRCALGLW